MNDEVRFLVRLRDGAAMIAEAAEEYLQTLAPQEVKANGEWNPDKIRWMQAEGPKGSYERSEDVNNPAFKAMVKDLQAHNGKLTRDNFFYWKFRQAEIVGRKTQK